MNLPAGFLDELRSRTSLSQVVGRKVMWDARKSNQGKGDMWAPCPFHQEKSASFHVDDRKGFYYCFGCHAKGDAISFVMESENVGFMESVEILAREAGMTMPARDPKAQEKSDRRGQLAEVMEQAAAFYRLQLKTGAAHAARSYLSGRGVTDPVQERWEIGFAPDGWQSLWDHLRGKGVAEDLIFGAGLAKPPGKGGKPYDTFRNRIMFPIRDARGRCIAFGGRAMDPNDKAKYLNSPETDLFDKGRSLFNHGPARAAAGRGKPLIVAEGYMDVIALEKGGFPAAVAPLGTAITETQLQMLWRIAPEPVIALDGDTAGLRAAMRLMDLALPLLEAGQSLRFALMPEKMDPDDLIRDQGSAAMQKLLDQAIPMVRLLWRRETDGKVFDSPERKAMLDKALREKIKLIRDPSIRSHYGQEIKNLRWELFSQRRTGARRAWTPGKQAAAVPLEGTKASILAAADEAMQDHLREAVILATVIAAPEVIPEFESGLEAMTCADPVHRSLRDLILSHPATAQGPLSDKIAGQMGPDTLENLHALRHVAISPCVRNPGDVELARMTLSEELAKLTARRGLTAEIAEAVEDLTGLADEALTWRLSQAAQARNRAERSEHEDKAEYDTGDNGARINRQERDAFDALLEKIMHSKPKR
ncbi:DNA primase [Sedimentitalea sp. JM2-8]|uniref:DNA primase n=1 Tax=Sedimentitalea xiamensis TaxID=3050037 RepID=A0ABT7FK24_9RHOB|nr:DNA primase [Sedimentitalea xiamensis]MDK3075471.1 DNA primase [Sedimentitalea xiamensis]